MAAAYLVAHRGRTLANAVNELRRLLPIGELQAEIALALEMWERLHPRSHPIGVNLAENDLEGLPGDESGSALFKGDVTLSFAGGDLHPSGIEAVLRTLPHSVSATSLLRLDLALCALTESAAISISALLRRSSSLLELKLFGCDLSDAALATVLRSLYPSSLFFDEDEPPPHNRSLRHLDLGRNLFASDAKDALTLLARRNVTLEFLALDSCGLADAAFLDSLVECLDRNRGSAIRALSLNDTDLSSLGRDFFVSASHLQLNSLSLCRCNIDVGDLPADLARTLLLDGNKVSNPDGLSATLNAAGEIRGLSVSACGLGSSCVEIVVALSTGTSARTLGTLDVSYNPIGRDKSHVFGTLLQHLDRLSVLRLEHCDLKTKGAASVFQNVRCECLLDLDLSFNDIHDSCDRSLCHFLKTARNLRVLRVAFNLITADVVPQVEESLRVTSETDAKTRLLELTIDTEGNPCGANAFGCPFLCRRKFTNEHK